VPLVRATRAEREYFLELARRFGLPRCDVAALVRHAAERLGLRPDVVGRAAEYARILRASGTTYRVAAAAGLIAAALEAGIYVPARCVAQVLRCTEAAAREALRRLRFALALRSR
jgi:transcription initiation factor TFIIIB Brf1 subunit/transcription initiation factor TFIIB